MAKINCCRKGKANEREASHYLARLLGTVVRRGQQHAGGPEAPDVVLPNATGVHFEIKADKSIGLGTKALNNAMLQSIGDAGVGEKALVLWKEHRKGWRLSYVDTIPGVILTVAGDDDITATILRYAAIKEPEPCVSTHISSSPS